MRTLLINTRWDEQPALLNSLLSAVECNRRWRLGLFSPAPAQLPASKKREHLAQYYSEIARVVFATDPVYALQYHKKPAAFARAVKDCLDQCVRCDLLFQPSSHITPCRLPTSVDIDGHDAPLIDPTAWKCEQCHAPL